MGHKVYFWMMLVIFIALGILIQVQKAHAMIAAEIEPGIVELSTTNSKGFEINEVLDRTVKKKNWVYFCLSEKTAKRPLTKCFYGRKQDFGEVKEGLLLNGIQYGLSHRIHNVKGAIAIKKNAYFYPALILRPQI